MYATKNSVACYYKAQSAWLYLVNALPLKKDKHPNFIRWISLLIGCIGMAMAASTTTFSFWQNAMRAILNQTETESNMVMTIGYTGSMIAFPAGMLYESWGCQADAVVGGFFSGIAYLLLWQATGSQQASYVGKPLFAYFIYFFVGFGCIFIYMASLMPNVDNFPYNQRGKVIGLLDAALSLGPTFLSILYNTVFTHGFNAQGEEGNQDLSGFFLTMFLLNTTVCVMLLLFNGRVHPVLSGGNRNSQREALLIDSGDPEDKPSVQNEESDDDSYTDRKGKAPELTPPNQFAEYPFSEISITRAVRRWSFIYLTCQFLLSSCTQITFQSNITTYLRSFGMSEYNMFFTVLNTTLQAVTKFFAGIISDRVAEVGRSPRAIIYILPYALQTFSLVLSIFYGDNFFVLLLTCLSMGAAFGATWCQTPTLIGELFGSKYLGSNWGWCMLLTAILGFPFSIGYSAIYEAAITEPGEIYCYGLQCFTWSYVLLSTTSLGSLVFSVLLTRHMFRNAKLRQNYYNRISYQRL